MENLRLNFIPLVDDGLQFDIYRKKVTDTSQPKDARSYRVKLPEMIGSLDDWAHYDACLSEREGFEKFTCDITLNQYLSEFYVFNKLKSALEADWKGCKFRISETSKHREVCFEINTHPGKGVTEVIMSPYFLKSNKKIGFIFKHHFHVLDDVEFDREIQILSLSLDKSGRPNIFNYRDEELIIRNFFNEHIKSFMEGKAGFPLENDFIAIQSQELLRKLYLVGRNSTSPSQFMGVKNSGPYRPMTDNVRFVFAFTERTRSLARDVYLGLTGKLFPGQFPGLNSMFGIPLKKDMVSHYVVDAFNADSIEILKKKMEDSKIENPDHKIMLVVVLPKGFKGKNVEYDAYGHIKLMALEKDIFCQVITEDTFQKKDQIKWSISNVGLQIFSKLGGAPWLVKPAKKDCLILGLGQSHEKVDGKIKRYVAYTVCLDSSGDFKYIKPLSNATDESEYLNGFSGNLRSILENELRGNYRSFVLHIPFKIRLKEIKAIKEVVKAIRGEAQDCEVVAVRINTKHRFLGLSEHNTRIPYEGSYVRLSYGEFLVWAEGLQHGKEVVHKRVAEPLYIDFIEPPQNFDGMKECMQDILNLTGANWRGFNSKAQPISILYSKLIANFMKEFSHLEGCDDMSILSTESRAPWFL